MNSRERVLLAIDHREADRVPLDWNGEPQVSAALQARFGLRSHEELLRHLHVDLRHVDIPACGGEPTRRLLADGSQEDVWGVRRWPNPLHGGYTYHHPLAHLKSHADLDNHPWPDPDVLDYDTYPALLDAAGDRARVGGSPNRVLWTGIEMVGLEKFLLMLYEAPDLIHALLGKITDYYYAVGERCYPLVQGKLDIAHMGSDFGTQLGLLISPPMWREFVKPHFSRLFAQAKGYRLRVFLHSDGAIREVIPDLIEMGLDVLNPIQVGAAGMEPAALKRDFGDRLCFHGSIDVQKTLPFGRPEDVRREVIDRLQTLGPGGGFILSCSHSLLPDVPLDNVVAMYETAYRAGHYGSLGCLRPE